MGERLNNLNAYTSGINSGMGAGEAGLRLADASQTGFAQAGNIWVESRLVQGSTFVVKIPLGIPQVPVIDSGQSQNPKGKQ